MKQAPKHSDYKRHVAAVTKQSDKPRKQHGPNHPPTLGGPAVLIAVKTKMPKKGSR